MSEETYQDSVVDESIDESIEQTANDEPELDSAPDEPTEQDKVQKRIDKAIYEKHQARRELEQAKAEAAELRARFEQGESYQKPSDDIQALVKQEAARMKDEENFNAACNKTHAEGIKEFGQSFDKAMQNLGLVGMPREFLELVSEADYGARILSHLGGDLDEAERIAALSPVRMARELTKLDIKLGSQKVKQVSKAPPPITPVSGKSGGSKSPAEMTDAEYSKWRKSK